MKKNNRTKYLLIGALSAVFAVFAGAGSSYANQEKTAIEQVKKYPIVEYRGEDKPQKLFEDIVRRSKKQTLFVMFYDPGCPHCRTLTGHFSQVQDMTDLDFEVLRVNVNRSPVSSKVFKQDGGVPEVMVLKDGEPITRWTGAFRTIKPLVDLMADLKGDESAAPVQKTPAIP